VSVTLAVVQPRTYLGADEERNVDEAVRYIDAAARRYVRGWTTASVTLTAPAPCR